MPEASCGRGQGRAPHLFNLDPAHPARRSGHNRAMPNAGTRVAGMSGPGLSRAKNLRAWGAGIPIVDGTFPGLPPEQARGMVWPQGGTLIAAISGWILTVFMTHVRL
jgi:hypothetical protein